MENSKLKGVTDALVVLQSVDQVANAAVAINQPVLNFPGTLDAIMQMNGTLPSALLFYSGSLN
jgi:hypothetical protein